MREGGKTGHIRFEGRTPRPDGVKLTLRFDEPTKLSDDESKEVGAILDDALQRLETLLKREALVTYSFFFVAKHQDAELTCVCLSDLFPIANHI